MAHAQIVSDIRLFVCSVPVGKVEGQIILDLSDVEDKDGDGDLPIAIMPREKKITLLQLDGRFTQEEFEESINLAFEGVEQINELQREALLKKYTDIRIESESELQDDDDNEDIDEDELEED